MNVARAIRALLAAAACCLAILVAPAAGVSTPVVGAKPFFFFAGAFFYPRIPPEAWARDMQAMRRLGANTLDLYVPWNWHEPSDGAFDFDGHTNPRRNLRRVLRLARLYGFRLIVRPGPVIRNEWRNGGYPAWLLARAPYDMPQHDILEGRYPATATLQNAASDAAAAQWLANPTHLRYTAAWLRRVLAEFRPYADLVLAIQLDDDQGAYADNRTWPAPHLQRYLRWLDAQVHAAAGPRVPTFINTYEMKVPASSPVWAMGNWYGTAAELGEHDRLELDFATAVLQTQPHAPLAISEFQAGWLAAPEDPQPRTSDPQNTALALAELLGWGAHGVVMFPLQDTLAPFGWEAPFSNAFYNWDAALPRDLGLGLPVPGRQAPVAAFGELVGDWGPRLAAAQRVAAIAIAYEPSAVDERALDQSGFDGIAGRFKDALRSCIERGLVCDAVDLRFADERRLRAYRTLVVPPPVRPMLPAIVARLERLRRAGVEVVDAVPDERGTGVVPLASRDVTFGIASNWTDAPVRIAGPVRIGPGATIDLDAFTLAPRSARVVTLDLRLRAFAPSAADVRVTSTCRLVPSAHDLVADATGDDCTVVLRAAGGTQTLHVTNERLPLGSLTPEPPLLAPSSPPGEPAPLRSPAAAGAWTALAAREPVALVNLRARGADGAIAYRTAAFGSGDEDVVIENARLRAVVTPGGGARLVVLQRLEDAGPLDATNATGALRDDVLLEPPPSRTDRIAQYTHSYPAGTFNRPYRVEILAARGAVARVRFSYAAPDVLPRGARFEKTLTLAADAPRLVVDERVTFTAGHDADRQRAVTHDALALPPPPGGTVQLDPRAGLTGWNGTTAIAVSWARDAVERAGWTPYASNGTLTLVHAPGSTRITYGVGPARDADEAAAFARSEREWLAMHPNSIGR